MTPLHLIVFNIFSRSTRLPGSSLADPISIDLREHIIVGNFGLTLAALSMHHRLKGVPIDNISPALTDLIGMGFIREDVREPELHPLFDGGRMKRESRLELTKFGHQFLQFITDPLQLPDSGSKPEGH